MSRNRKSIICRYCKDAFEPMKPNQFYCSLECRFWDKVDKLGPDDCWNWTAKTSLDNYGQFSYKGRVNKAHRIAWLLTHGSIPDNLCILHHCDNSLCCNPAHLFSGTHTENMRDMVIKCRHSVQRLTPQQVKEIKIELSKGTIQRSLAKQYGVTYPTICHIKNGKCWSYIVAPMFQLNLFP